LKLKLVRYARFSDHVPKAFVLEVDKNKAWTYAIPVECVASTHEEAIRKSVEKLDAKIKPLEAKLEVLKKQKADIIGKLDNMWRDESDGRRRLSKTVSPDEPEDLTHEALKDIL
jgi:uncharacterized protein YhaN